ncbi:MAG TPA: hypothetical protein VGA33_10360, partial [Thermoanaerobaculia bacterium]
MRKTAIIFFSLQILVLSVFAADKPKECTLCVGQIADLTAPPSTVIPLVLQIREADLTTTPVDTLSPEQRAKLTLTISYTVDRDKDPLLDVETHTKSIVEWARLHGPFEAIGVAPEGVDTTVAGYAVKRLAVSAQGQNVASRIVLPPMSVDDLNKLYETGALTYVDALLVDATDVAKTAAWILEKEPSKKLFAIVTPQSPNAFYDLSRALADGATRGYTAHAAVEDVPALANFNQAFIGDWAFDSTASTQVLDAKGSRVDMPVLTFVRGEDLRTNIVPRGDPAAATIASLPSDRYTRPRRVDAAGDRQVTDVGAKGGHFLVGVQPVKHPFLLTL